MKKAPKIINPVILGNNIKKARLAKNIKQKELAKRIDIATNSISYYEKGRSVPSLDLVAQMAYVLEVDISDLVEGVARNKKNNTVEDELFQSCMKNIAMLNNEIKQEEIFDLGSDYTDTSHQENMKRFERYKYLFMSIAKELKGGI